MIPRLLWIIEITLIVFLKIIVLHRNYEFLVQDTHHPLQSIRFKKRDGAVKHGRLE